MAGSRRRIIDLAIMAGLGVMLALMGPFGTYAAPFGRRLIYWLLLMVGGYGLYRPAMALASRSAARLALPTAAMWAAACIAASAPMTMVVLLANAVLGRSFVPAIDDWFALYGNVLVIGGAACAILWFVAARSPEPHPAAVAVDPLSATVPTPAHPENSPPAPMSMPDRAPDPAPARFLDRLPPHLGSDLLALEMEDHYLRAHTRLGSHLLLMRMRDAVAELDGVAGMQVHRSWWVARGAVEDVRREGRAVRLILPGGLEAPVSRDLTPTLRDAGWF